MMAKVRTIFGTLAAAAGLSVSTTAHAQEITPLSLEAHAHSSLVSWQEWVLGPRPCCIPEVLSQEGMVFLDVRAVFDVPWSEDLTRVNVRARDINVILEDGTELGAVGAYENYGMFKHVPPSAGQTRPRDWPESDSDLHYHAVFLIPADAAEVTLVIGETFSGEITVPPLTEPATAASYAEMAVTNPRFHASLSTQHTMGGLEIPGSLSAPDGFAFLELTVDITGLESNDTSGGNRFHWRTHNFHLVMPDGIHASLIGERFQTRIFAGHLNSVDVGQTQTEDMIWAVPVGVEAMALYFGGTQVAEIDLSGVALPE